MYTVSGKAIITTPVKLVRQVEKARLRRLDNVKKFRQIYGVDRRTAPVVIACRDPQLNHHFGQRYPADGLLLATENWKKKKQDGDSFVITPRPVEYARIEKHSFEEASGYLSKRVLDALELMGLKNMTPIQRKAMESLTRGLNAFVASEMGSGKTIAYLAPVVDRLLCLRKSNGEPMAGCPRALILSPTWELNEQIYSVSKRMMENTPGINVSMIRAGNGKVYASELDHSGCDLLIASVGTALRYRKLGTLKFDDLRHVVIDETDTMLSEDVRDHIYDLVKDIKFKKSDDTCSKQAAQLILVASTCPDDLQELTSSLLGEEGLLYITDDRLHRLQHHILHRFIRMDRQFAPEALLTHVKEDYARKRRVGVFTRDADTCQWVEHFLEQSGIPTVALRGTMSEQSRFASYRRIIDGDFLVMVATDAAALGLDTRHLQHIVNYQLPFTIGGYLRRAGRVGRFGGKRSGTVTSFVTNFWEVDFVEEIEKSVRLNMPLSVNDVVKDRHDLEE